MDAHAERLLETLNENGYEAFVVGGCVRMPFGACAQGLGYYQCHADAVTPVFLISSADPGPSGMLVTVLYRHMP
ncbi:MAG: hypothetical protein ACLRVT_03160 [Oscillospiraceae bacterium]